MGGHLPVREWTRGRPHPNPLPEGEGNMRIPFWLWFSGVAVSSACCVYLCKKPCVYFACGPVSRRPVACGRGLRPETDVDNAVLVHGALPGLTLHQASIERMWVYLSHNDCPRYVSQRWLRQLTKLRLEVC